MTTGRNALASLGRSFTVEQARAVGLSRHDLRALKLHQPTRAVRSLAPPATLAERLSEFAHVLPEGCAFSHLTAARIWGLPLPSAWSPSEPIHVMTPDTRRQPRRRGVISHAGLDRRSTLPTTVGHPVTSAADTWVDLVPELPLDDLVVAGDALFYHRRHLTTLDELWSAFGRVRRGRSKASEALSLIRVDAASVMETRTRLVVVRGGLPEPELNAPILDEGGDFIGFGDLVWREQRVVVEYDGDQHRTDRVQWQRDHRRLRALRAAGWTVIVLTADDIFRTPTATVALLRDALGL